MGDGGAAAATFPAGPCIKTFPLSEMNNHLGMIWGQYGSLSNSSVQDHINPS